MRRCIQWHGLLVAVLLFSCPFAKADLIAYYPLDEDTTDQSGNGLDGEIEGIADPAGPGSGYDGVGGSYEFGLNGQGHIVIPLDINPDLLPELTVTMWARPDESIIDTNPLYKTFGHDDGGWDRSFGLDNRIVCCDPVGPFRWAVFTGGARPGPTPETDTPVTDEWTFLAAVWDTDNEEVRFHVNENFIVDPLTETFSSHQESAIGNLRPDNFSEQWFGWIDEVRIYDTILSVEEIEAIRLGPGNENILQAGDADRDFKFDQLDLVMVQVAAKYLTGQVATWGDGDWDGAPGGSPDAPPVGNGLFDQVDIIAALNAGLYLTGPYNAIRPGGVQADGQTSITYDPATGAVGVDAPAGVELTSINIDSEAGVFTGDPAANLGGSFDNDADNNIFKATFGSSFGSISFGNVAQSGLLQAFLLDDLTVVGSLAGGGDLGDVDLIYVPEPAATAMLAIVLVMLPLARYRRARRR